jgi:hypothetical protein
MDNIKPVKMNELLGVRSNLLSRIGQVKKSLDTCRKASHEAAGAMSVRCYSQNSDEISKVDIGLMIEVLEKQKALYEKELEPTNKIINSIEVMLEAHQ